MSKKVATYHISEKHKKEIEEFLVSFVIILLALVVLLVTLARYTKSNSLFLQKVKKVSTLAENEMDVFEVHSLSFLPSQQSLPQNTQVQLLSVSTTSKTTSIPATTSISVPNKVQGKVSELTIPILTYHRIREYRTTDSAFARAFIVTPEDFAKEMKYLSDNGYTTVTLADLVDGFNGKQLPKKSVIITFDDGFLGQYTDALPVLKKYHFIATFFIYTNAISAYPDYMTWNQVKDLYTQGMTIGAHTKSHAKLTKIKNRADLEDEILGGKKVLEQKLGIPILFFAYPYGLHNQETEDVVKKGNFVVAVTTDKGETQKGNNLYGLERDNTTGNIDSFKRTLK